MLSIKSKKNWMNWHHKFHKQFLSDKHFIPLGANLLVAVSGGQDSMALMTLINEIKNQHDWRINVWHGDHQWHQYSSEFANQLEKHCDKSGIPFFCDVANIKEITTEEKARDWRYKKLSMKVEEFLKKENSTNNWYILTGHTSTDNTETFLLNLARGSYFNGLSGIPKQRLLNNKYALRRPILIFSRKETAEICKDMQIPFWEDPTNFDLSIKRNVIRHKVLPYLDEMYPGYTNRINHFIGKMNHYKNEQADLSQLALKSCKDSHGIKREIFNTLGKEAKSTILHTYIKEKYTKQIDSQNIETISLAISSKSSGQINLSNTLKIMWNKNTISLKNF